MNWYIVQAYSGFEKKVVESIKEELKRHKLDSNLDQLLIPTHQVTEVKKGKRSKKEKKYFPGYVLLKVELTKQIYHLIKNLQKVLVDYEPANQDPILAAQYLSAVVGSIVASSSMPDDQKKEILKQILDFISYVYDQQTQTPQQPEQKSDDAFGVWKPK